MATVEIRNVRKAFGPVEVLHGVSVDIADGEFVVLVGRTSKGRKGSSWDRVRQVLISADTVWTQNCVVSGLSSGEGLIHHVRDAIKKKTLLGMDAIVEEGIEDKRLFALESEFASVLKLARNA